MQHSDKESGTSAEREGTLPIDFGTAKIRPVRKLHVQGTAIVSDEAGGEDRLADLLPHGQVGIEATYVQGHPIFNPDFAARRDIPDTSRSFEQTFDQAEPNDRADFIAGRDLRYADQTFEEIEAELHREHESSVAFEQDDDLTAHQHSWGRMRDEIQHNFREARRQD